ncbi:MULTISPECIES: metal-sulfur cluster assembly factor [Cytobacillus]|uniref:metal-sulfur cluster assembly factor n=1 Tax=Cytobacillus TaxID=2675230 RepID=UPI00203DE7A6|nr:metal-sulfur cluster assembly factor [Cytobacillus firmus]MCM3705757.1 metal-sulfur cluster assembly factor [Cytobacillus firmus]URM34339.1 metal-sulfur cluster assembly factor [Cytobacillus firmus]
MNRKEIVLSNLKRVMDPELNINVVDLGLIYDINIPEDDKAVITMTLTTPGCPLHDSIVSGVRYCIEELELFSDVEVNLVWEPAWTPARMTPEANQLLRG